MKRRITHRMSLRAALGTLLILSGLGYAGVGSASAQVVIDLPPPKRRQVVAPPPPAPPDAATPATVIAAPPPPRGVDPGALAMHRYTRTRYVPDDPVWHLRPWRRTPHTPGLSMWFWHGGIPVLAPPTVIIFEPTPIIIKPGQ